MLHARFDDAASEALTNCVKEIEKATDVELVLIVRARSGVYRHADYLFAAVLSFLGLLFLLFSPFEFHHYWVAIDVALLFVIGAYLSSRSSAIRRRLTTKSFRETAVRTRAAAMFYEAGIANTSAEMGLLVYLSLFERRLELIADRGVLKGVPALEWNQIMFELHEIGRKPEPETLQAGLAKLGSLLAEHLPATGENPNELPDAPRFELN
jgi:putative membrane protein